MESLKETLTEFLSPDPETKQDAKLRIEALKKTEKFGINLTEILVDSNCELTIRELSAKILKEWIEIYCSSAPDQFQPPEMTADTNHKIQTMLLSVLEDSNTEQYNKQIQVQAVEIFTTILHFLALSENCDPNIIWCYLKPFTPLFCKNFTRIMKEKNSSESNVSLKSAVVKAITILLDKIPKFFFDFASEILAPVWETLMDIAQVYQEFIDNGSGDFENKDRDSNDKTANDYDDLVSAMFDFIEMLMSGPFMFDITAFSISDYDWFYLQGSLTMDIFRSLIIFLQHTDKQIEIWTNDPSRFITEEEFERTMLSRHPAHSIRTKAQKVLLYIVGCSGGYTERWTEQALTNVVLKQLTDGMRVSRTERYRISQNNWKQHEAFLLAFCIVRPIIEDRWKEDKLQFDVTVFLEHIVLPDLDNSETHPLVICRCLRLGRLYIKHMALPTKKRFLKATIKCLDKNQPMCTRICAAHSAHCWFKDASTEKNMGNKKKLRSHIPVLFNKLLDLGDQSTAAEVFGLILENFAELASLDQEATASVGSRICKFTVAAFVNTHDDHTVRDNCRKIFQQLAQNPECTESLQEHLIPALVNMMTDDNQSNELAETARVRALLVLETLVKNWLEPLEQNNLFRITIPALYHCVLNHNDHMTLVNGAEAVCTYLSVAASQIVGYEDTNGKTGSQYILQIASHLLNPEFKDVLVKYACNIVALLIKQNDKLGENINELLKAVINRLGVKSGDVARRQLFTVCARLINSEFDAIYKYLSSASGPNGQSAFTFVLYDGFCKEYKFYRPEERKEIALALTVVLNHGVTYNDSNLHKATVQEEKEGMETTVPLLVAIAKFNKNSLSKEAESVEGKRSV